MYFKFPENTTRVSWTRHIKNKMVYYGISANQILRIFRTPERREEGIAEGTIAAMKSRRKNIKKTEGVRKNKEEEIWIMYKLADHKWPIVDSKNHKPSAISNKPLKSKVLMISAWRYPGKTKPGERPPIPQEIMEELMRDGLL